MLIELKYILDNLEKTLFQLDIVTEVWPTKTWKVSGNGPKTPKTKMWPILKDIYRVYLKITENIYKCFPGIKELERANVKNLARVPLVNKALAERIKLKLIQNQKYI